MGVDHTLITGPRERGLMTKRTRTTPSLNIYRPPPARRNQVLTTSDPGPQQESLLQVEEEKKVDKMRSRKQRRPDIQVYVPRAKRAPSEPAARGNAVSRDPNQKEPPVATEVKRNTTSSFEHAEDCLAPNGKPLQEDLISDRVARKSHEVTQCFNHVDLEHITENKTFPVDRGRRSVSGSVGYVSSEDEKGVARVCQPLLHESVQTVAYRIEQPTLNIISSDGTFCNSEKPLQTSSGPFGSWLESCNKVMQESGVRDEGRKANANSTEKMSSNPKVTTLAVKEDSGDVGVSESDFSTEESCSWKKDEDVDECERREEQNRKNRQILRGNFMSDVLIISDPDNVPSKPPSDVVVLTKGPENDVVFKSTQQCSESGGVSRKERQSDKPNLPVSELSSKLQASCQSNKESAGESHSPKKCYSTQSKSPPVSLNPEECTWDMLFDDDGECLDPKLMEELTSAVGSVNIEKPRADYRSFVNKTEAFFADSEDEFSHVVEIYNFPPELNTRDLITVFSPYKNGGFEIKWVDDTHALAIFSSSVVAAEVLAAEHPFVKTRPLSHATDESQRKARRSLEFLQPYRSRPETCAALARRLVTGALGVRLSTSREERDAERKLLKEAREKKRLAARQREEAWEGTLGGPDTSSALS